MMIVIDVNVILSALIKDSTTRAILIKSGQEFCFPEISLQKIRKYQDLILKKSGLSEFEFLVIFHNILRFIRIIPNEELLFNWNEAKQIMEHIDPEDVPFIAVALCYEDSIIWSDDTHFDKQTKIKNLKTGEIVNLFYDQNE